MLLFNTKEFTQLKLHVYCNTSFESLGLQHSINIAGKVQTRFLFFLSILNCMSSRSYKGASVFEIDSPEKCTYLKESICLALVSIQTYETINTMKTINTSTTCLLSLVRPSPLLILVSGSRQPMTSSLPEWFSLYFLEYYLIVLRLIVLCLIHIITYQ